MSERDNNVIKVGSRKSELALIQTRHVISLLKQMYPEKEYEIVTMTTLGDRVLNISLPKIGEKSLFTKDLEEALHNGSVDMVVHSLKDLPTSLPEDMAIGAVLEREDPRDALVLREDFKGHTLASLPPGSIIGTSSLRRTAQISRSHPHLRVVDIRGNLNTRLRKLDHNFKPPLAKLIKRIGQENFGNSKPALSCPMASIQQQQDRKGNDQENGNKTDDYLNGNGVEKMDCINPDTNGNPERGDGGKPEEIQKEVDEFCYPDYAALILAQAGLVRMGWQERISQVLPCKEVLYAVGQGALAIECRADNTQLLQMLAPLNHQDTYCRILAERSFLRTLGGGCSAPVAIATTFKEAENSTPQEPKKRLKITGAVWSLNGKTKIQESIVQVFDEHKLNPRNVCPFDTKNKAAKHKLSEKDVSIEEPDSKISKGVSTCRRFSGETSHGGEKKVNCCRMKTLNMTMDKAEPVEIENLINIHGKLFMSCPFSEGVNGICPVEFPIGQEVMGECPYLSETDEGFTDTLVKMHPRKISYDIKKCPFMSNQVVAINAAMEISNLTEKTVSMPSYNVGKEPKAKNCPFLKLNNQNVTEAIAEHAMNKMNEANSNSTANNNLIVESEKSNGIKLYCGLTKHMDLAEEMIDRCEELGKQLAHKLIEDGALEVMQCAQDFIRSSIPQMSAIVTK